MSQKKRIISISLPPGLLADAEAYAKKVDTSRSQLFQDALGAYLWEKKFKEYQQYGMSSALERGIKPDDIDRIIHEYRAQ